MLMMPVGFLNAQNLTGDEALSKVLIEGEGWQEIASGFGMTDGACGDAEGNLYFSDLPKAAIHRVAAMEKFLCSWKAGPKSAD